MVHIYPAIMGIDPQSVSIFELLAGSADRVHIDIMDTVFVPNVTQGSDLINEYAVQHNLLVWAHLMVQYPESFYSTLELPQGSLVSFHIESNVDICSMIKTITEKKHLPSIAISPKTPIEDVLVYANSVYQILVMSVDPGFSGQSFLDPVMEKIKALVTYRKRHGLNFLIGVDGGINRTNLGQLVEMGIDDCAVSSGIFNAKEPISALNELRQIAQDK